MKVADRCLVALALLPILAGLQSCKPIGGTYNVNTFRFVHSDTNADTGASVPSVWINTNTRVSSLSGGDLTSSLPCAVMIDFTDNSRTFKDAVITSVKIAYDDGAVDPSIGTLKLPKQIAARDYESVNSVAGGRIVKTKVWLLSGSIPKAITRAEPFRLQMEGHFTKNDGSKIPFTVDQHFDIEKENTVKSAEEVLQDK